LLQNKYAKTVLYRETAGGGRTLKVNTKAEERTELYVEKETGLIKTLRRPDSVAVTMRNEQPLFFILDSVQVLERLAQTDLDELIRRMGPEVQAQLAQRRKGDLFPIMAPGWPFTRTKKTASENCCCAVNRWNWTSSPFSAT
jgi:hypothetical protein